MPVASWEPSAGSLLKRLAARARAVVRSSIEAGVPHLIASVFSVQGVSYLAQLAIARRTGPGDFAIVRTVEAVLSTVLVLASLGMPMLAVTKVAGLHESVDQGRMLGALTTVSLVGAAVTASLTALAAPLFPPAVCTYLRALCWVICLTACSRTCIGYFQGRKWIRRMAGYTVGLAAVSLVVVVGAVWVAGLDGWVVGRYVSEAGLLGFLLVALRQELRVRGPLPGGHAYLPLVMAGFGIAISLLVRTAADNAGLLLLNFVGAPAEAVGHFGLTNLVVLGLLIVPISIGSVALPRIVQRMADPRALRVLIQWVTIGALASGTGLACAAALAASRLIGTFLPAYRDAVPILLIMVGAVPFRTLSALAGMILVAHDQVRATVLINVVGLTAIVAAGLWLLPRYGASGAAWATLVGEVVAAGLYGGIAMTVLRSTRQTVA